MVESKEAERLRGIAADLRKRADRLIDDAERQSQNAPGSYITGRSGRTRAQNNKTDRALEKTIKNAVISVRLREKAQAFDNRAHRLEHMDEIIEREKQEQIGREAFAVKDKARRKALVLVNDPSADAHITSAEWAKKPRDYKDISERAGYKIRAMLDKGSLSTVYLTDKKTVLIPTKENV